MKLKSPKLLTHWKEKNSKTYIIQIIKLIKAGSSKVGSVGGSSAPQVKTAPQPAKK